MAYSKKDNLGNKQDIVNETQDIYKKYTSKRDTWAQQAKEDK